MLHTAPDTAPDYQLDFHRDTQDVTSNHRPDPSWSYADKHGHVHCWYSATTSKPATDYVPLETYHVPSVVWVKTGVAYYPDGSPYDVGYYACIVCGDTVDPGYCADSIDQVICVGPVHVTGWAVIDHNRGRGYVLNGEPVPLRCVLQDCRDFEEFEHQIPEDAMVTPTGVERREGGVVGMVSVISFRGTWPARV